LSLAHLPTLFPYTTLFRSPLRAGDRGLAARRSVDHHRRPAARYRVATVEAARARGGNGVTVGRVRARVVDAGFAAGWGAVKSLPDRKSTRLNSSHDQISYA